MYTTLVARELGGAMIIAHSICAAFLQVMMTVLEVTSHEVPSRVVGNTARV